MARHDEYVKYGMYAAGAYLVYKYVWPTLTSEVKNITSSISTSVSSYVPGSNIPASAIASVMNPSGLASSSIFGIGLPVNTSTIVAGNVSSPNINEGMAIYYITDQDAANIRLMSSGETTYNFDLWKKYYRQAKGIELNLTTSDVGIYIPDRQLDLTQFRVLVNSHFPKPTLSGIYGPLIDNRWYGVA